MTGAAAARAPRATGALARPVRRLLAAFAGFAATWRKFRAYARPLRGNIALAFAAMSLSVLARLAEPWPVKLIIDGVLMGQPPEWLAGLAPWAPGGGAPLLWLLLPAIPLIALAGALCRHVQRIQATRAGIAVGSRLRGELFDHLQRLPPRLQARRHSGDLVVRVASDVRILRDALTVTPLRTVEEVLFSLGMLVVMFALDWQLSLIALALLPLIALVFRRYQGPMRQAIRKQRAREGAIATTAAEALGAARAVQGFGQEKSEVKRFGKAASKSLRSGLKAARLEAKLTFASEAGIGAVTALVVGVAALRIRAGDLTVGDVVIFAAYLALFYQPIRRLSRTVRRLQRAASAGERIGEVMAMPHEIADGPDAIPAPRLAGRIDIGDVHFSHREGLPGLRGVSLRVAPGELVTLVGPSGAGKSTLLALIPRFIDPTEGTVCIDGTDIRRFQVASLRRQVALVFQEPVLLRGTVAENIAYGRSGATRDEVRRAAEAAGIGEVIENLPAGYDTRIGERGATLSGGQRQCVAIARAVIMDAPIVLLDEPLTGLDPAAARQVATALARLGEGRTVLTVTHDTGWLGPDDRVVAVTDGRIAADGPWRDVRDAAPEEPGDAGAFDDRG